MEDADRRSRAAVDAHDPEQQEGTPAAHAAARLLEGEEVAVAGFLFDMDGTLVDSLPAVEEAWRLWCLEHGLPEPDSLVHGRTARDMVTGAGVPAHLVDQGVERLSEIESRPGQVLSLMSGTGALLAALPAERWGVVTSATRRVSDARLAAAGVVDPHFRVTGDDVERGKPDPEPFRLGTEILHAGLAAAGVAQAPVPAPPIAVEDSPAGTRSAMGAGCLTIAVAPENLHHELRGSAHIVLTSLEAVQVRIEDAELLIRLDPEA